MKLKTLFHTCHQRRIKMSIYKENGYTNRNNYLNHLSEDYGIELGIVLELADLFGPEEDFDGLLEALDDYGDFEFGELL
jgi:hypothetical protein